MKSVLEAIEQRIAELSNELDKLRKMHDFASEEASAMEAKSESEVLMPETKQPTTSEEIRMQAHANRVARQSRRKKTVAE